MAKPRTKPATKAQRKRVPPASLLRQMRYVESCNSWPEQAAEATDMTLRAWQRWKAGTRRPRPRQLERLAAVCAVLRRERRSDALLFDVGTLLTEEERGDLVVRV